MFFLRVNAPLSLCGCGWVGVGGFGCGLVHVCVHVHTLMHASLSLRSIEMFCYVLACMRLHKCVPINVCP